MWYQVIIDQISLKILSNKSVFACNLNVQNSILIAIEFMNGRFFFFQFHAQLHIGHITTPSQPPPN